MLWYLSHFVDFNVNLYLRKEKENGKYMRNENMELHFVNVVACVTYA